MLSTSLEESRDRLEALTLRVADLAGTESPELFNADLRELESLRMEHEALKAEFESHTAAHQLSEKRKAKGSSGN
jgi:hypothetical protein